MPRGVYDRKKSRPRKSYDRDKRYNPEPVEDETIMSPSMFPQELPSERATTVVKERGESYGHPGPIHADVAVLWNLWLGVEGDEVIRPVDESDVAIMLMLLKVARQKWRANEDNLTDICGYADVHEMVRVWVAH